MKQIKKEYILYGFIAIAFFFIGRFSNKLTENPNYQDVTIEKNIDSKATSQTNVDNIQYSTDNENKEAQLKSSKTYQASQNDVPQKALEVLAYIRKYSEAPDGYVGGRTFQNRERLLPQKDEFGEKINYREWDIYPKIKGRNRGAERLVSSDESAYYTGDHYRSFIKIKE